MNHIQRELLEFILFASIATVCGAIGGGVILLFIYAAVSVFGHSGAAWLLVGWCAFLAFAAAFRDQMKRKEDAEAKSGMGKRSR